ncbi:MAG: hypothetical protein WC712_00370 [Candidatus Brocadiia bacterium]
MLSEKMRIAYIGIVVAIIFLILATRPARPSIVIFALRPGIVAEKEHCDRFAQELDSLSKAAGKAQYFVRAEVGDDVTVPTENNGRVGLAEGSGKVLSKADVIVAASPETAELLLSKELGLRALWIASAQDNNVAQWHGIGLKLESKLWLDGNLVPLDGIPAMLRENGVEFERMALYSPDGKLRAPEGWLVVSGELMPPGAAIVVPGSTQKMAFEVPQGSFLIGLAPDAPSGYGYRIFKEAARIEALMARKYLDNEYRAPAFKVPMLTRFVKQ